MIIELKLNHRYFTLQTMDREWGEDVGYVDHDKGTQVYRDSWSTGRRFGLVIGNTMLLLTREWGQMC